MSYLLIGYFIILTTLTFHDFRIGGAHASVDRDVYASRSIDDADREVPPVDDRKDASV